MLRIACVKMYSSTLRIHVCFVTPSVNYRGSRGYGQDYLLSVIGRIGDQDVKDVQVSSKTMFNLSRATPVLDFKVAPVGYK